MQIKFENLSAKNIINFYPSLPLTEPNTAVVTDRTITVSQPFLQNIMNITGVTRCLVTHELISVQYEGENFSDIKLLIMAETDDFFAEGNQYLYPEKGVDIRVTAEALADAFVRPTLNRDNGDIEILDINDDKMELKFTGHCAGCPYAQNTLQNVIVRTFQKYLPQLRIILKE